MCVTDRHDMTIAVKVCITDRHDMTIAVKVCVTDRHDMTIAVKVALNPNTTNQLQYTADTFPIKFSKALSPQCHWK